MKGYSCNDYFLNESFDLLNFLRCRPIGLGFLHYKRHINLSAIVGTAFLSLVTVSAGQVDASTNGGPGKPISSVHDGVKLIALPLPAGKSFSVPLVEANEAIARVRSALDLIVQKSPVSASGIDRLKRHGAVTIVYRPDFPDMKKDFASNKFANFLPLHSGTEKAPDSGKGFLVVIGRHGIKRSKSQLAGTIVHELVGHGLQHLEDRMETMRRVDWECEARLHEELMYQNLALDKHSTEMISFRKHLENDCDGFARYLGKEDPTGFLYWERLNPDVPKLVKIHRNYLADLRRQGTMEKALQLVSNLNQAERDADFKTATPERLYSIGIQILEGVGGPPDPAKSVKWFERSASGGYARAQYLLAKFYYRGIGVRKNTQTSYFWSLLAANSATEETSKKLASLQEKLFSSITPEQVFAANRNAQEWRPTTSVK